jgi:hypothetical protein
MDVVDYKPASFSGTAFLGPWMTKRLIHIENSPDLEILLTTQDPFYTGFSEDFQSAVKTIGGM